MAYPVLDAYDALLVDLDGTVFAGSNPIDGAAEGLDGRRVIYVTNNASRAPEQVAEHLASLGFPTTPNQVLTSAMAACDLGLQELSARGIPGRRAYVIGADSFRQLATRAGFEVVDSADNEPNIVFQGHSPSNSWAALSEGALAIRNGAVYVASNLDTTLPSERGLLVGNGSMVAAVVSATGVTPLSAGKPGPAMFELAAQQVRAQRPLAVGDRLDTDIAGGNAAGFDTLCTVTGVSGHWDILSAAPEERPTHIAGNLRDHLRGWSARILHEVSAPRPQILVTSGESGSRSVMAAEALAAVAPLVWSLLDGLPGASSPRSSSDATSPRGRITDLVEIIGEDALAQAAIEGWR